MEVKMKTGNLALSLVIMALIAGLSLGAIATSILTEPKVEIQEVPVEVPTEVIVEIEKNLNSVLNQAVDGYLEEVKETLDKYEELDKIEVSDDWAIQLDEDLQIVDFTIEYRVYDTLSKSRADYCKIVEVVEETDEETIYNTNNC
jgi:hypothetical protein